MTTLQAGVSYGFNANPKKNQSALRHVAARPRCPVALSSHEFPKHPKKFVMQTQVLPESSVGTAWLEHDPPGGATQKTPLASFPFTIGRNDSTDLRVDSHQVSREHAAISRQGRKYLIKDLGSTNGTFLNGQRISEAVLNDGDLLMVADVELTFYSGAGGAGRQTATQVMSRSPADGIQHDTVWETILAVRRTHEVVTHRCLRTLYQPIIDLTKSDIFGYEALAADSADGSANSRCETLVPSVECRAASRLRQLFRRLAVEEAASLPHGGRLLLAITAAESSEPALISHLCQLRNFVGSSRQIVVEIPDSAVRGTADFRALLACLRDVQIQVAYDGYASGKARISEHKDVAPDYLKLAPSLFGSVHSSPERQRQVQLIVKASQDLNVAVIATGIDTETDLDVCQSLECTLAQGKLFGMPQTVASLIHASRTPPRERQAAR
jgi:EAL domain-containing protein (putative c-di-GMP-specific phosphodiesterase class I)